MDELRPPTTRPTTPSAPPASRPAFGGLEPDYRRIGRLSRVVIALELAVTAVAAALVVVAAFVADDDTGDGTAAREEVFAVVALLVLLVVGALALLIAQATWSARIAANLRLLGRSPLTWSPSLSVLAWLLSSCTLGILTYLMVAEHWKASDPDPGPDGTTWPRRPLSRTVVRWIGFGICVSLWSVVVDGAGALLPVGGGSGDDLAGSPAGAVTGVAVALVGAVLHVRLVRELTDRHARATGER